MKIVFYTYDLGFVVALLCIAHILLDVNTWEASVASTQSDIANNKISPLETFFIVVVLICLIFKSKKELGFSF